MDFGKKLARSQEVATKISLVLQKRTKIAQEHFSKRVGQAFSAGDGNYFATFPMLDYSKFPTADNFSFMKFPTAHLFPKFPMVSTPWNSFPYMVDAAQRMILFWDTLRQRGNYFVANSMHGTKPVLHFDYDMVLDAREFARPVNYALLRITPPAGVTIDPKRRPYLVVDPRAGHGPGIGGFKDDSQVGVALRAGHPVYFVTFFREPEPGQTLLDVCSAEQQFVKKVRALHPDSQKPAIIGNCQGGWAAMMLAASGPDETGPIVINGAPMSYWSGAWEAGEGDNPMRYSGGLLGGTWLASFMSDLGHGTFDGAYLVENFENLNPANTLWDKNYNVYANIDTEPPRFLDFERWWGDYFLLNREEIEWITRELFVGNKLWSGDVKSSAGKGFDLRDIKSPIILFASMGDNITPPEQAFNWVADIYGSTEEIKARGQVIVGLLHKDIGHLGIFVSGKVAKKEHTQIVSVLQQIERMPPGLYGMKILDKKTEGGRTEYEVEFEERQLEEVVAKANRFQRVDEKPFEVLAAISDFNQQAYEMFMQPLVQAMSTEYSASLMRRFHPLRFQRWAISDINPWLAWLAPAAEAVRQNRQALDADHPMRKAEKVGSELISASLDYYRAMRDAFSEAAFFRLYTNVFSLNIAEKLAEKEPVVEAATALEPRELPFVKDALASIAEGGYTEACARVSYLLARKGEPLPLSRLAMRQELVDTYAEYLPDLPGDQWRRIRGEQEIIARYEPEQALDTLPTLLANRADRERMLTLLDKLISDERVQNAKPTEEQLAMFERIRKVLDVKSTRDKHVAAVSALKHGRGNGRGAHPRSH